MGNIHRYYRLGCGYVRLSKFKEALDVFKQAVKLVPNDR